MKGRYFGNMPVELDLKLRVVDAYNSAGVMIDAIRGAKLALDRVISGPLESISDIVLNILLYRCHIPKPKQISWSLWKEKENDRLKIFIINIRC